MKTVLITGISRGAGNAFARQFLETGWHVIGTSTSGKSSLKHEQLATYKLDLSQQEQIRDFVQKLEAEDVKLDLLINNAGINLSSTTEYPAKPLSIDILRKTLEVNLVGLATLTEKLLPLMQPDSQIVAMTSGAGAFHPFIPAGTPSYQISKTALNMYIKTLAERLKDSGIIVWLFDPGWMKTDMGGSHGTKSPEQVAEELYHLVLIDKLTGTFWTAEKERSF
jgi:NAD(P)-dependent dehydrogenase (short-subunit alcohol dehydrogenase family)